MLGFSLLSLAASIPFRSRYLYHWDSVNFALSLFKYDVRLHQPHPPGYFFYSMLGRLVNVLFHDPNTSLVAISIASGAFGVAAIYWLGNRMFSRKVGVVVALLAISSPMHWFQSEVALSYELEFFIVILLAGLCYLQICGNKKVWPWLAILLGIAGGLRQNDLLFLLPLWLFSLVFIGWRERILSVLFLAVISFTWLVPMIWLSGGIQGYLSVTSANSGLVPESALFLADPLLKNFERMGVYFGFSLILGFLALPLGIWMLARKWKDWLRDRRAWTLTLWILPSFIFYGLIYIRQAGYIFTILPVVFLIVALVILEGSKRIRILLDPETVATVVTAVVVVANAAFFLAAPFRLFGLNLMILQTPSWHSIHERGTFLGDRLQAIRARFNPATTVVIGGAYYFRHPDFYLPDYVLPSIGYELTGQLVSLPPQVDTVVFLERVFPPDTLAGMPVQSLTMPGGGTLDYIHWPAGSSVQISKDQIDILYR